MDSDYGCFSRHFERVIIVLSRQILVNIFWLKKDFKNNILYLYILNNS